MDEYLFYRLLADGVVLLHILFVVFVVCGGILTLKWRRLTTWHISAALWGTIVEFAGWVCPLTPLENWLRGKAGQGTYPYDFVARYLLPLLYPEGLTRRTQIMLGLLVIAVNMTIYGWAWLRRAGKTAP